MIMPLDICLESYGAAVHVVDSLLASGLCLRSPRTVEPDRGADTGDGCAAVVLDDAVRVASRELGFAEAQALWLVDVCGCSYDEAADEARTTRDEIAGRVAGGRRHIRSAIAPQLHA